MTKPQTDAQTAYPRRNKRKQKTRAQIIAAANTLVRERGAGSVTVTDIAERADVHVTTLFNHFETRGALFAALSEPQMAELEEGVAAARAEGVGFFAFLRAAVHHAARQHAKGRRTGIPVGAAHGADPELVASWLRYERLQITLFTAYIADEFGMAGDDRRAFLIASMIVSANIQIFERWQADPTGFDLEAENLSVIEAAETMIKGGVRG